MDIKLFVLMVIAFFCGSIKNSINDPEPFSNNLARVIGNRRATIKYPQPYHVAKYNKVRYDDDSSMSDNDKGMYTYIWYITITAHNILRKSAKNGTTCFLYLETGFIETDALLGHESDPVWCKKVSPDCNKQFTKEHCKEFCDSGDGKSQII